MTEKRFYTIHKGVYDELKRKELHHGGITSMLNSLHEENEQLKHDATVLIQANQDYRKENEKLKQTIETQNFNYNNAKSIIHSSEKQIWRLEDRNEQLKKGMIEVVDRYIRNVEHNPPSSTKTYLKVKGALDNVREGLRDLLEDLE